MTRPTEEQLMAYADGLLSPEQRLVIEQHLTAVPADRALVDKFKSATTLAQCAVDSANMTPRADLVALLRGSAPIARTGVTTAEAASTVVPFLKQPRKQISVSRYALPLAAGLALVVGFGGGYIANMDRAQSQSFALGPVAPGSKLFAALDNAASGSPSSSLRDLQVVATFHDRANRPCREVEHLKATGSNAPVAAAIACRDASGWTIEGAARVVAVASTGATKPSGTADRDALASVLDGLGAKPALSRADEQKLIEQRWR